MRILELFCSLEMCLDMEQLVRRETWSFAVSKKKARLDIVSNYGLDDISHVNSIVAWNLLAKSKKLLISSLFEVQTEKMQSMNRASRISNSLSFLGKMLLIKSRGQVFNQTQYVLKYTLDFGFSLARSLDDSLAKNNRLLFSVQFCLLT